MVKYGLHRMVKYAGSNKGGLWYVRFFRRSKPRFPTAVAAPTCNHKRIAYGALNPLGTLLVESLSRTEKEVIAWVIKSPNTETWEWHIKQGWTLIPIYTDKSTPYLNMY